MTKKGSVKKASTAKPASKKQDTNLVRALVSFVATVNGQKHRGVEGETMSMPAGADWLQAGLVEPVGGAGVPETAAIAPSENALAPAASAKPKRAAVEPVPSAVGAEAGTSEESDEAASADAEGG